MKKFILTFLFVATLFIFVNAEDSLAAENEIFSEEQNQLIKETNELLDTTMVTPGDLENYGWELVTTNALSEYQPFSLPTNSRIFNSFYKSTSEPGLYLAQATWEYNTSWDSDGHNANDVIGITIEKNGSYISPPAQKGGISVFDGGGSKVPYGWVSGYKQSGASYNFYDYSGTEIGDMGGAWFYISKPSDTSGNFAMRSRWEHNGASTAITLNSVSVSYPLSINASWSSPSKFKFYWGIEDQIEITW